MFKETGPPLIVLGQDVYSFYENRGDAFINKFSVASNSLQWTAKLPVAISFYSVLRPAADANYVYYYGSGSLAAINAKDGTSAYKIPALGTGIGVVVLSSKQLAYAASSGFLEAFNLATRSKAWSQKVSTAGAPALANNAVYIVAEDGGTKVLQARAADSGDLLWASGPLDGNFANIVVTDNLAFVSSDKSTLAIDLKTHRTVWQCPLGGNISISNRGVLYINTGQAIVAINLQ